MAKMELTFWYKGKAPGEVIEVSDPENPRWRGFAKPLGEPAAKQPRMTAETPPAKTLADSAPKATAAKGAKA